MSNTKFEIRDYGGLDGKRLLKNGKVINEFGMWIEYQQLEQEVKELKTELEDTCALYEHGEAYVDGKTLAQHNKEVAIEAIEELKHRIIECREMELSQGDVYTIDLIAEQFKQGFDVFETPDAV